MACKVLQLEGFVIGMEEAELLASFFNKTDCLLVEFDLHQAELTYDVIERLGTALKSCDGLKAISFSKNNLGIDDFDDTDSDFETETCYQESTPNRNRAMCPLDQKCMTESITQMTKTKHFMERLCLAHCHIHDRGMKILADELDNTRIRYLNISWCRLTAASVPDLCRFIKYNRSLEKCLM